ncbi:MAG: ABC transporter ATP-binding protein [Bacteroidales bacterium]|nr:ABC transporter ATP-binding protein [Bacteroidales bacterium]
MNYNLNQAANKTEQKKSNLASLRKLITIIGEERRSLTIAFAAILLNAGISLLGPYLIGHTIDKYIQTKQFHGVLVFAAILLSVYIVAFVVNYIQMLMMGGIGQRMLFSLRNAVFNKLQELPVDFFNQNKSGDLISRINNDTDKVNQFFSQSLMQFIGSLIIMIGAGIFLLCINLPLGIAALSPALIVWFITKSVSPWVKRRNAASMKTTGALSAEVQESLANFKVIIAFNRRDYFRKRFEKVNKENYAQSIQTGIANTVFMPIYTLAANIGQLIVLSFGIYLIIKGLFTLGLLISFIAYINNFYNPLRQLAALWASFQVALAGWDRISLLLSLENNLDIVEDDKSEISKSYLTFRDVSFQYPNGKEVLFSVNFDLEQGKTYAFVGPTGGGKTTIASLIARLYDTTKGKVLLDGKDIRSYKPEERSRKIGFILQEPFLFSGTVRDNILYGNVEYKNFSNKQLEEAISDAGLEGLLQRFDQGLETVVQTTGDGISLGQKQLIAFMRAVLRKPELLILDEATANIDTITEQLLDEILKKLPPSTTRVIIAHRLNTIENADEIFFVNTGNVTLAGSFKDAINLLLNEKIES